MRLSQLELTNFRNYTQLELPLPGGSVLLYGANAQGKTTILEAIYYLATTKSPSATQDRQLLNWYAADPMSPVAVARLKAVVQPGSSPRPRRLEIRLIQELNRLNGVAVRREVLVNGVKVRLMDLLGNLNVVLFVPQDVGLVSAPPSERRRYLDITLCQVNRHYCRSLAQYNRVLSQRNALLRAIQERRGRPNELAPWDQKLAELGATILLHRAGVIAWLERRAGQIHYEDLTGSTESLRLLYQPNLTPNGNDQPPPLPPEALSEPAGWLLANTVEGVAATLRDVLQTCLPLDLARGLTLVGPHRDDLRFVVNGRDLADYGSRGQQRTAVLALKLAEIAWMQEQTHECPILLLDEVLAELDQDRRAYLLHSVDRADQAILTATDPTMFTAPFLDQAALLRVSDGQVAPIAAS